MPVMSTFGGASQRQGGRSNHMFRPPINITSTALGASQTGQNIQFTWCNLTRQADRALVFTIDGTNFTGASVASGVQTASFGVTGGNFVATYSAWTYYASNPAIRTLNSPNATVICPPLAPTLLPPSWNDTPGYGFYQLGVVYGGGGQTRITYNAMPGTVTYNIEKNYAPYLTNVTMPYTLTHTGANGTLASYTMRAIGSAGGQSVLYWQIMPYNTNLGAYVTGVSAPSMGDQVGEMSFANNNLPGFGVNYLVTAKGKLIGECVYCGSSCFLQGLNGSQYANVQNATVFINTGYNRGYSASTAALSDMYYLFTDFYNNGPATSPTYYGTFGYYELDTNC